MAEEILTLKESEEKERQAAEVSGD